MLGSEPVVEVGAPVAFYRHGWHSWSPTGWVDPSARRRPIADLGRRLGHDDPAHALDEQMGGSSVGAVQLADGSITLLGALAPGAWVWPGGSVLRGASESGEIEWFVASGDERDVFAGYAEALADRLGRRGGTRMRVWCSWYSLYESITEAAMNGVLSGLGDLPFDVVQIDDGWEEGIGDWQPNGDFPGGMAGMAERIRAGGRRAGLWLAPLIAHSSSQLANERSELLLHTTDGEPVVAGINWGGPYFALDPSAQATTEFLGELIGTVRGWGYDYLKLDFLYGAAFPGFHATEMPREVAYRQALQVIRDAAGEDCYLLACGAPILASIGIFDGIRIGPDVAEFWEEPAMVALGDESARGARNALATSSQRLWLRPAIDTDPDVAYFGREEIDLDERTIGAVQDLAQIAGFLGVSDPPASLTKSERAELERMLLATPTVVQVDRYRWQVNGQLVDFSWVLDRDALARPGGRRR
jgi:alpha-galactosidase